MFYENIKIRESDKAFDKTRTTLLFELLKFAIKN